ncbi:hypothetical protein C8J56DRAFT_954142, partial [Mycena floridula]
MRLLIGALIGLAFGLRAVSAIWMTIPSLITIGQSADLQWHDPISPTIIFLLLSDTVSYTKTYTVETDGSTSGTFPIFFEDTLQPGIYRVEAYHPGGDTAAPGHSDDASTPSFRLVADTSNPSGPSDTSKTQSTTTSKATTSTATFISSPGSQSFSTSLQSYTGASPTSRTDNSNPPGTGAGTRTATNHGTGTQTSLGDASATGIQTGTVDATDSGSSPDPSSTLTSPTSPPSAAKSHTAAIVGAVVGTLLFLLLLLVALMLLYRRHRKKKKRKNAMIFFRERMVRPRGESELLSPTRESSTAPQTRLLYPLLFPHSRDPTPEAP